MNYTELFQKLGITAIPAVHTVMWHGRPNRQNRRVTRYHSNNLFSIHKQLDVYQAVGFGAVIGLTYGLNDDYMKDAAEKMYFQCWQRKLRFMFCVNQWIVSDAKATVQARTDALMKFLDYAATLFVAGAYAPEMYVLDFQSGADLKKVGAAYPRVALLDAYHGFAWPKYFPNTAQVVNDLAGQNISAVMPAMFSEFNDAGYVNPDGTRNLALSVWADPKATPPAPARIIDSEGGNIFFDVLQSLVTTRYPQPGTIVNLPQQIQSPIYVQYVTGNDRDEGTDGEKRWCQDAGIRIADPF
jgi:hypothetical protein